MAMSAQPARDHGAPHVPFFVPIFNPLAHRLLGAGIPLGPNALLTVRGRKSGQPRTTPVALVEVDGRRWIIGMFGEVNWVRNLRAAPEATITVNRQTERIQAIDLPLAERTRFFKEILVPYVRRIPLGGLLLRMLGGGEILSDPDAAAGGHPVFELRSGINPGSAAGSTPDVQ